MSEMSKYCKAYPAERFRNFPGWHEKVPPLCASSEGSGTLSVDNSTDAFHFYYLHDNYVVTAGVFVDQDVAYDEITEGWKAFCNDTLGFVIPEYVATAKKFPPAETEIAHQ